MMGAMGRLSSKAHKALTLLASSPSGADEPLMIAHGFKRGMLDRLVFAGLATIVDETMQTGTSTIEIERYCITDDGRKALNEVMRSSIHHVRSS
jgi:hypothetical protein